MTDPHPSPLDIDAIFARADAATPGPWSAPIDERFGNVEGIFSLADLGEYADHEIVCTDSGVYPPKHADAAFIAHARTDIPLLVTALRSAHAEIDRLRAVLASEGYSLKEPK